ncbi:hypothetical protein C900_01455 [Fulvivirga imtechensis AK7]|uniref:Uncharacterized protein n=1 Tax=Fulvivirga imtechensis AK7 TaxID=1237149 RepID=L8JWD3_9BACT|nr:hypothetical protein C900_01455 [Fulvivirga imtechensis AK7]
MFTVTMAPPETVDGQPEASVTETKVYVVVATGETLIRKVLIVTPLTLKLDIPSVYTTSHGEVPVKSNLKSVDEPSHIALSPESTPETPGSIVTVIEKSGPKQVPM